MILVFFFVSILLVSGVLVMFATLDCQEVGLSKTWTKDDLSKSRHVPSVDNSLRWH